MFVRRLNKVIRAVVSTIVVMAVILPALIYVMLSLGPVQQWFKSVAERELSEQLGAAVSIDDLTVRPFNRADVSGVNIMIEGDTVGHIGRLSAGIDLWSLITSGRITINYATVLDVDLKVNRATVDSPLNIQPIIDRLTLHDPNKPKSRFNLRVNTVVIRNLNARYDVLDCPPAAEGIFDPNHIFVRGLRADASLPRLSNDAYAIDLKRLDMRERSGFRLDDLTGRVLVNDSLLAWEGIKLAAPRSLLDVDDGRLYLDSIKGIGTAAMTRGVNLTIGDDSRLYPPSFAMFMPALAGVESPMDVGIDMYVSGDTVSLRRLHAATRDRMISVDATHAVVLNPLDPENMRFSMPKIDVSVGERLPSILGIMLPPKVKMPSRLTLTGNAEGSMLAGGVRLDVSAGGAADADEIRASLRYHRRTPVAPVTVEATLDADNLVVNRLVDIKDFESLSLKATVEGVIGRGHRQLAADVSVSNLVWRRHLYDKLHMNASVDGDYLTADMTMFDADADFTLDVDADMTRNNEAGAITLDIRRFDPSALNLIGTDRQMCVSGNATFDFDGIRPDRGDARLDLRDFRLVRKDKPDFILDSLIVVSRSTEVPREITVTSDIVNGRISGDYDFKCLPALITEIAHRAVPVLDPSGGEGERDLAGNLHRQKGNTTPVGTNVFEFTLSVDETEPLNDIFKMPVTTVYPSTLTGKVNSDAMRATVDIKIPFMRQGNKLIEGTKLSASLDGVARTHSLTMMTKYPSNDGLTTYTVDSRGVGDRTSTDIGWRIDRQRLYDGDIHLDTRLSRDRNGDVAAQVDVLPGHLTFNDSVWTIHPAEIIWSDRVVSIDRVNVSRDNQYVRIDGRGTAYDTDTITIDVCRVDLDYVFGAIGIENFQLGGLATGQLYATSVVSDMPHVSTPGIDVENIAYNQCVLGQGLVTCTFDMSDKAFHIDGTITQPDERISTISGRLMPFTSELDFDIHADHTPVGFMGYYMKAFAGDISGYGTGDLHLFGTFHDVDLEGEVWADDFTMRLDFTNTYFSTTDSIHISPGTIVIDDVTIRDPYGHTGRLTGRVTHDYFRSPKFDFTVTDVDNMLVYNEPARPNADWYGRIFASGTAEVSGDDTTVRINIDVKTDDNSLFTFVLSELEIADEYTFLTFRDKEKLNRPVEVVEDVRMTAVNDLRERLSRRAEAVSANYIIEVKVDITPEIEVDLVMDPVAGDKIRSHGSGNLRMLYTSSDEDLRIFGTYRLDRGDYNFTLQDIIIKDFVIKEGSTISFTGDPLTARLDINAYYAVNANLTDLDKSFSEDKELNRTNIPVHAVLHVTGDIQNPQIGFDLEFPTLNSDTDRKIRSIISTDEMLNRQIIYLLALNRFYTPDYMSTTKGNELFSVASSTLSSQLSNMLGQLSDKWVISPNIRSDRGDFSDMEVDVALGSRLLNNRLLLNGNFGYRDKSLNTNQFIGDFDIEYLLNPSGTIRLKAYNHFNDQNYYVRTANTTQGVGVMFKHDFDNIFGFLRRRRQLTPCGCPSTTPTDTLPTALADTIPSVATPSIPTDTSVINHAQTVSDD